MRVPGRGRPHQRAGVRHLRGGGQAASRPGRAPGPGLRRGERTGQGDARGEEARVGKQRPEPAEPEGQSGAPTVGQPGVGGSRSAPSELARRHGAKPRPELSRRGSAFPRPRGSAFPRPAHAAVRYDQRDVTARTVGGARTLDWPVTHLRTLSVPRCENIYSAALITKITVSIASCWQVCCSHSSCCLFFYNSLRFHGFNTATICPYCDYCKNASKM